MIAHSLGADQPRSVLHPTHKTIARMSAYVSVRYICVRTKCTLTDTPQGNTRNHPQPRNSMKQMRWWKTQSVSALRERDGLLVVFHQKSSAFINIRPCSAQTSTNLIQHCRSSAKPLRLAIRANAQQVGKAWCETQCCRAGCFTRVVPAVLLIYKLQTFAILQG